MAPSAGALLLDSSDRGRGGASDCSSSEFNVFRNRLLMSRQAAGRTKGSGRNGVHVARAALAGRGVARALWGRTCPVQLPCNGVSLIFCLIRGPPSTPGTRRQRGTHGARSAEIAGHSPRTPRQRGGQGRPAKGRWRAAGVLFRGRTKALERQR